MLYTAFNPMQTLSLYTGAVSRSISAENPHGEKGMGGMSVDGPAKNAARDLGQGWKVSPYVNIDPGVTHTLAEIEGPGEIRHIWLTCAALTARNAILRMYWDDSETPSVECPLGDFFCNAYLPDYQPLTSLAVCVNPRNGLNCYFSMPFRKNARITLENRSGSICTVYYQIDYVLCDIPENAGYFHAQFRRSNPLPYKSVHTLLEGASGRGQYIGTYMAWGVNNNGWWGEGEIKFFLDGDKDFPTICGTGTEDYFCGAYNFDNGGYERFCTPYSGMIPHPTDQTYKSQKRFSLYRFHITDPICFAENCRVTIQALGWRSGGRYLPLQDDISSVAFWYQDTPITEQPPLPDDDALEII